MTTGAEKSAPARARAGGTKNPLAETSGRGSGRESPVNIRQFGGIAPSLAAEAISDPERRLRVIMETADSNDLARYSVGDDCQPFTPFRNKRDF